MTYVSWPPLGYSQLHLERHNLSKVVRVLNLKIFYFFLVFPRNRLYYLFCNHVKVFQIILCYLKRPEVLFLDLFYQNLLQLKVFLRNHSIELSYFSSSDYLFYYCFGFTYTIKFDFKDNV